jgi:hypothetical protein
MLTTPTSEIKYKIRTLAVNLLVWPAYAPTAIHSAIGYTIHSAIGYRDYKASGKNQKRVVATYEYVKGWEVPARVPLTLRRERYELPPIIERTMACAHSTSSSSPCPVRT